MFSQFKDVMKELNVKVLSVRICQKEEGRLQIAVQPIVDDNHVTHAGYDPKTERVKKQLSQSKSLLQTPFVVSGTEAELAAQFASSIKDYIGAMESVSDEFHTNLNQLLLIIDKKKRASENSASKAKKSTPKKPSEDSATPVQKAPSEQVASAQQAETLEANSLF